MDFSARVKYNPGILGDEELIRSFVVRQANLEMLLEAVRENSEVPSNRHMLVVGPRGIGKTTLVRRVAAEIRAHQSYAEAWLPVVYGEESYQVSSAGEFWLEALIHLSATHNVPELNRALDELRDERDDARLRERALAQLLDYADDRGKRLVLVVENLNMLCEDMPAEDAWTIRHTLLHERRIMLIGTAISRFDAVTNPGKAWFELFAIHELKPLDKTEARELWISITRGELNSGHVRAIRILTGGNPRLLAVLAGFAAKRSFRELMDQLVHLIDDHTEYFKSHLDALASKERKVFVSLLELWNPASAADVARTSRLNVNEVSALLNRLVSRGAVEIFEHRPRRKLYQASERLYNIYYLMRRRGEPADRVRAAVNFMVLFYSTKELATTIVDLAREAGAMPAGTTDDHFAAYAELVKNATPAAWDRVLSETPREFFERADAPDYLRSLPKSTRIGGLIKRACDAMASGNWEQSELRLREALELSGDQPALCAVLGSVLLLKERYAAAIPYLRKAVGAAGQSWRTWWDLGRALRGSGATLEEAEHAYRNAISLDPNHACVYHQYGVLLARLRRLDEGQKFCERAIQIEPNHASAWSDLAYVLKEQGLYSEADYKYRRSLDLDTTSAPMRANFASFLTERQRFDEAAEFYREAIRLEPGDQGLWSDLGHLLSKHGSAREAEEVWSKALAAQPGLARCAVHLLDARAALGTDETSLIQQAEEWIARSGRKPGVLGSMARFVVRHQITRALPKAMLWASEAVSQSSDWGHAETLAFVCGAEGKWGDAIKNSRAVLDAAVSSSEAQESATQLLIQGAAAGFAKQVLDILAGSPAALVLEPLVVGLRLYLGESPQVAKEIMEIGNDVAERIRETARSGPAINVVPAH